MYLQKCRNGNMSEALQPTEPIEEGGRMQFSCPVCNTAGDIETAGSDHPVVRTTCRQCQAILMVNPGSGEVEAHKAALKDEPQLSRDSHRFSDDSPSVLFMGKKKERRRDWPAIAVLLLALLILAAAGFWLLQRIL
jgi:hypothetical protein